MKILINIILLFSLISCGKSSRPPVVSAVVAPIEIELGDSFNIIITSTGGGVMPEIEIQKIEQLANVQFISSHQKDDFVICCYKIRPKKVGNIIVNRGLISAPNGSFIDFKDVSISVSGVSPK